MNIDRKEVYKKWKPIIDKLQNTDSTEYDIKDRINKGLITSDLEPIKCESCESQSFDDEIIDCINSEIAEKNRICSNCNKYMGTWSYGYWQP